MEYCRVCSICKLNQFPMLTVNSLLATVKSSMEGTSARIRKAIINLV